MIVILLQFFALGPVRCAHMSSFQKFALSICFVILMGIAKSTLKASPVAHTAQQVLNEEL